MNETVKTWDKVNKLANDYLIMSLNGFVRNKTLPSITNFLLQ